MNPLLKAFDTTFETPPFDSIEESHFLPALEEALKRAREEVQAIIENEEAATFANTIEALERSGELVSRVAEIFYNLNNAETNAEIQKIAREFSPLLSEYGNDVMLNPQLFKRVKAVHESGHENLDEEQQMLLEKTYRAFANNGANLAEAQKGQLREIDRELAGLSLQFGENVLAETNEYELVIEKKEDLAGLPEEIVEAAAETAAEHGKEGQWVFTLHHPSYLPFMTYASLRHLREKLNKASGSRAFKNNARNNAGVIKKMINLRYERAQLLGFSTHADYMLQERMAETPQKVHDFLDEIQEVAKPAARQEVKQLTAFARERDGIDELQKWDFAYYTEKLKQKRFQIDDEKLKPYFVLEEVVRGAFEVAHRLYGLSFEERKDIQKYHPEVYTYNVKDREGRHQAVLYADFFPRPGKRNGAWMTGFRSQKIVDGQNIRPLVSVVCNFTKPTKTKPSLLTFNEVLTLFHEFGHALHAMMANGKYGSLSGASVYWDFVELPSQIMENWCYEKECLDIFARHYKTGEAIPADMVERLKASATFMEGYATLRQVSLARLDLAWHDVNPSSIDDVGAYEQEVLSGTRLLPAVPGSNMSTSFHHLFQGGYSAGYYSYKWAEVLDADAFEYFSEKGIFNAEVARKFQKLLAAGGSLHPSILYRQFRGKDPDPKALLRRAGLLAEEAAG